MPDIAPPGTPRALAFEQMSQGAGFGLPPAAPLPRRPGLFGKGGFLARRGRLLLALLLVGAAALALLRQVLTLSTDHAVITAHTLPVRAPIGGEVTDLPGEPGAPLPPGLAFARIENSRADRGRLLDALQERDRAQDEVGALIGAITTLEGLAQDIGARGGQHREAFLQMIEAQLAEAGELRMAARARAIRAAQDARRAGELARGGHASQAARDGTEAESEAAHREAEAQGQRILALQRQGEAARHGLFLQPGQTGAAYAEQRQDEITLRRMELTRQLSQQQKALVRAERRLAEEREQHEATRSAILNPPPGLILWRLHAQAGQRVLPDEVLAEMVDCRQAFLLAAVPQSALPRLPPGSAARLRLAGESTERQGIVTGRHGESEAREAGNLAAQPSRPPGPNALLRIAIPPPPPGAPCPVGRVGRVIFDGQVSP